MAIVVATEKMIDYKYKEFTWIVVVIPTVGQFILDIANKKLQGALERKFLMKQVKKIVFNYEKKIRQTAEKTGVKYDEKMLEQCIENTPILKNFNLK